MSDARRERTHRRRQRSARASSASSLTRSVTSRAKAMTASSPSHRMGSETISAATVAVATSRRVHLGRGGEPQRAIATMRIRIVATSSGERNDAIDCPIVVGALVSEETERRGAGVLDDAALRNHDAVRSGPLDEQLVIRAGEAAIIPGCAHGGRHTALRGRAARLQSWLMRPGEGVLACARFDRSPSGAGRATPDRSRGRGRRLRGVAPGDWLPRWLGCQAATQLKVNRLFCSWVAHLEPALGPFLVFAEVQVAHRARTGAFIALTIDEVAFGTRAASSSTGCSGCSSSELLLDPPGFAAA
ncbi:MAG: hypothetical protein U0235_02815 [Polyangiaceae bacterium]